MVQEERFSRRIEHLSALKARERSLVLELYEAVDDPARHRKLEEQYDDLMTEIIFAAEECAKVYYED
jgi:hypothetical protein